MICPADKPILVAMEGGIATNFFSLDRYNAAMEVVRLTVYLDLVIFLNFAVDFLLILGTNRLCGYPLRLGRALMASAFGALYAGACFLPGFGFLGNSLWRLISLCGMGVIAFGINRATIRKTVLFVLLSMALGGISVGMGNGSLSTILLGAFGVFLMCAIGLRWKWMGQRYVDVVLRYGGKEKKITAMCDTGNTLKDPITGESVLVVGADMARAFLDLTQEDLVHPVTTMQMHPVSGLRLIPYRAVGQPNGMLLALRMDEVIIGKERAGTLVAFAPQNIGEAEGYQALTGGAI